MSEIKPTEETVKEMELQFQEWEFFLNNVIGILAFTLALGCLGTHSSSINALISFIFLSAAYYLGRIKFSRLYKTLRDKKDKTVLEKVFFAGVTKHFLGFRAMITRYTAFAMGYTFLMFVMLSSELAKRFPVLKSYFSGG